MSLSHFLPVTTILSRLISYLQMLKPRKILLQTRLISHPSMIFLKLTKLDSQPVYSLLIGTSALL